MTERQWQTGSSNTLIDHPVCKNRRKLRLLAIACARRMLPTLPPDRSFSAIIEAAEGYADDICARPAAIEARKPLRATVRQLNAAKPDSTLLTACNVLIDLANDAYEGFSAGVHNAAWVIARRSPKGTVSKSQESLHQGHLLRDIFGNPFRPVTFPPEWRTETAVALAQTMSDAREFGNLPILADALQDAGCENADVLDHCRRPGSHVRGCWVIDLILGKS